MGLLTAVICGGISFAVGGTVVGLFSPYQWYGAFASLLIFMIWRVKKSTSRRKA